MSSPLYAMEIAALYDRAEKQFLASPNVEVQNLAGRLRVPDLNSEAPIRLVFAGQYSAGKSTLICALTGREDIERGVGIVTDKVTPYEWESLVLVDTPGVHTSLRPDHDDLARAEIAASDLLVFVITNELMDSHIAGHFQQLISMEKANVMILVVNKMNRHAGGNTPEARAIMAEDLARVLDPYSPDEVRTTFVDAQNYLDAKHEDDLDFAGTLREASGIPELASRLTELATARGLLGRMTAPLYQLQQVLEDALAAIPSTDQDAADLEEMLTRHSRALRAAQREIQDEAVALAAETARKVRSIGRDSAERIEEGAEAEIVNDQLHQAQKDVDRLADELASALQQLVAEKSETLDAKLEGIRNSDFAMDLLGRLALRMDRVPLNPEQAATVVYTGKMSDELGRFLVKHSFNPGRTESLLGLKRYSGSDTHQWVKEFAKRMNIKLKPWEAVRWTKRIAMTGRVLSVAGIFVSVGTEWKLDQDAQRMAIELRASRRAVRAGFDDAATAIETRFDHETRTYVVDPLQQEIAEIDRQLADLREVSRRKDESAAALQGLWIEVINLIAQIHKDPAVSQ